MNDKLFQDYYISPLGIIQIRSSSNAITSLSFVEKQGTILSHPILDECKIQLNDYFSKKLTKFTLPINLNGTIFQKKVWETLLKIDYGTCFSYKEIAIQINNPLSVRAVANAISKNPILILIPCHRVIGSNKSLTGYVAGIDRKKALLELEKENNTIFYRDYH